MSKSRTTLITVVVIVMAGAALISLRGSSGQSRIALFPRAIPDDCNPEGSVKCAIGVSMDIYSGKVGYQEKRSIEIDIDEPWAITVDSRHLVYAGGQDRIIQLDSLGSPKLSFSVPQKVHCLVVDEHDRLYAGFRDRIIRFRLDGTAERTWTVNQKSAFITSIALSGGSIFVADAGMRRVWVIDTATASIRAIGEKDESRSIPGFVVPSSYMDIAVGQDNSIWVVNPGRHLVQNFRPNGDLLSSWGSSGTHLEGFCGCCGPIHMALMPNGHFVTAEKGIVRIKIYNQAGEFVSVVAAPRQFEADETGLDLAVSPRGEVLVLDTKNKRIRTFEKKHG